jgi:hypothetical protein
MLLAFLSLVMAGPIASAGAEINALSGRNFCILIVQPEEHHPGPLNDLNANDTWNLTRT